MFLIEVVAFFSVCLAYSQATQSYPVVLVPGVGGSQIEVKLTKALSWTLCKSNSDYFHLWANPFYVNSIWGRCINDYMSQEFLWGMNISQNTQGVEVRVKEFDKVKSVERLSDSYSFISSLDYMKNIVDVLVKKAGLKKDDTIRGAPYDWRKVPHELSDYFGKLARVVENAYEKGGNTPVVIMGHSMGCLITLAFLQNQSQEWKDKYIASFVSVNGPYGGATKSLLAILHGYNLDIKFISPHILRDMQRTFLSTYMMLPSRKAWDLDYPIFFGPPERSFTIRDLENGNLFSAVGYPQAHDLHKYTSNSIDLDKPIGVKVHCVYGDGVPTVKALKANKYDWPDKITEKYYGGGDGTVNIESLKLCEELEKGAKGVQVHYFEGGKHVDMLKSDKLSQLMTDIVQNKLPSSRETFYDDHQEVEEEPFEMDDLLKQYFKEIILTPN